MDIRIEYEFEIEFCFDHAFLSVFKAIQKEFTIVYKILKGFYYYFCVCFIGAIRSQSEVIY